MKNNFSDPDFIEKLKKLDNQALTSLVEAYSSHLFKAALGMGLSEEMASDVASSTWTTFLEVVPRFEGRSHIRTFLFGIFYNKVSELRRSNFKFDKTDPIEESLESKFLDDGHWSIDWSDPLRRVQSSEISKIVQKCLEHLPEVQRTAFYLKMVEDQDTDAICEILNVTNVNLRQLIFRSKNRIRNCVESSFAS